MIWMWIRNARNDRVMRCLSFPIGDLEALVWIRCTVPVPQGAPEFLTHIPVLTPDAYLTWILGYSSSGRPNPKNSAQLSSVKHPEFCLLDHKVAQRIDVALEWKMQHPAHRLGADLKLTCTHMQGGSIYRAGTWHSWKNLQSSFPVHLHARHVVPHDRVSPLIGHLLGETASLLGHSLTGKPLPNVLAVRSNPALPWSLYLGGLSAACGWWWA